MGAKMSLLAAKVGKLCVRLQAQKESSRGAWAARALPASWMARCPWRADGARDGHPWRRLEWPAKAEALGTWGEAPPRPHFIMVQAQQRHVLDVVILDAGGRAAGGSYIHWCDLP